MSYQSALIAAGCAVLDFVEFGCYQGEWLALVKEGGEIGVCEGSYGSCSYCDAFESEFGYGEDDAPDYQTRLADFGKGYLPANTIAEMMAKLTHDSDRLEWDDDYQEMLKVVLSWDDKISKGEFHVQDNPA
ncbi:hypothetical protein [Scandinavium sp.]|uniref:hypothetical protein n=1 Tax=Scandinavium sp. TaxID=2830653 RepID=UPI00289ABFB7|nr:hypothetical protein [Scandinavium sp.]